MKAYNLALIQAQLQKLIALANQSTNLMYVPRLESSGEPSLGQFVGKFNGVNQYVHLTTPTDPEEHPADLFVLAYFEGDPLLGEILGTQLTIKTLQQLVLYFAAMEDVKPFADALGGMELLFNVSAVSDTPVETPEERLVRIKTLAARMSEQSLLARYVFAYTVLRQSPAYKYVSCGPTAMRADGFHTELLRFSNAELRPLDALVSQAEAGLLCESQVSCDPQYAEALASYRAYRERIDVKPQPANPTSVTYVGNGGMFVAGALTASAVIGGLYLWRMLRR